MSTKIRLMKKTDLITLAKIYSKVYGDLSIGEHWNASSSKKLLTYWLKKQPDLCFVAEVNGKVAGAFVSGIKPWWDGNHLFDGEIFVDNAYQKHGLGSKLIKTLFDKAIKKYGAVAFEASTFSKTKFPLEWYSTIGITPNPDLVFISGDLKIATKKLKEKQKNCNKK